MARSHKAASLAWPLIVVGCIFGSVAVGAAENLALSHSYSWSTPPNYSRCTDPDDGLQLTDGKRVTRPYAWTDAGMVGWEQSAREIVTLTIDLQQIALPERVLIHTRSWAPAGILPPLTLAATSVDGAHFSWAGSLDTFHSLGKEPRLPREITLDIPVRTQPCRYVLLAFMSSTEFLFMDEIEVHGSLLAGAAPRSREDSESVPPGLMSRFRPNQIGEVFDQQRQLWWIRQTIPNFEGEQFPACSIQTEEADRLASRTSRWRHRFNLLQPLELLRVNPWDWIHPSSPWNKRELMPMTRLPMEALPTLDSPTDTLQLLQDEWGVATINVLNTSMKPQSVACQTTNTQPGAPQLIVRQAINVEAQTRMFVADALPKLTTTLEIQPGEIRQLWIDVDTRNAQPGRYVLPVQIGSSKIVIPVEISTAHLPRAHLDTVNWSYVYKSNVTRPFAEAARRDNIEHGINCGVIAEEGVPWPKQTDLDAEGHLIHEVDFTTHDELLRLYLQHDPTSRVFFYWDWRVEPKDPSRGRFYSSFESTAWKVTLREWLEQWYRHLAALGVTPNQVVMMPIDERGGKPVARILRLIKDARPTSKLAITVTRAQSAKDIEVLTPWADIIIHERRNIGNRTELIQEFRSNGGEFWMYDVPQPAKGQSALESYRMLSWIAWGRNLDGCGFWSYAASGDPQGNTWDDFNGGGPDFAVIYGREGAPIPLEEDFVPSRRWQAFRLGLQDIAIFQEAWPQSLRFRRRVLEAADHPELRAALRHEALQSLK